MSEIEKLRYEVYLLDMYQNEYGEWQENERHLLGHLDLDCSADEGIKSVDILRAMRRFTFVNLMGRSVCTLDTVDQRRVYAEDLYGCGSWWEVGTVKGHLPVYGLQLMEETV